MFKKKLFLVLLSFFTIFSFKAVSASEIETTIYKEPVIIGQYDGLLSDNWDPTVPMPKIIPPQVRINSYATYDSTNGVQVKVKLYVPSFVFPKPQFTSMVGSVQVNMNNRINNKTFLKGANGTPTIETDVYTGVKGSSKSKGFVTVTGIGYARNALAGGGAFEIAYNIVIP